MAIDKISRVPDELEVDGRMLEGRDVTLTDGTLDLAALFGGHEHAQQAFLFAEMEVAADGEVAIGAGCDFWMRWWIDGEVAMDTMAKGNVAHPIGKVDHCFRRTLTAGKHLLAVQVIAGTASWLFRTAPATPQDEAMSALNESDHQQWAIVPELSQMRPPRPQSNWSYVTAIRADHSYADVTVECEYQQESHGGNAGILLGAQDGDHYYYAYTPKWGQLWRARAFYAAIGITNGTGQVHNLVMQLMPNVPCHTNMWRTMRIERRGNEIQMWVNGVRGPSVRDDTYGPGRVGVAGFGDFLVRDLVVNGQSVEAAAWPTGDARGQPWWHVEEDLSLGDFQHPGQLVQLGDEIILPLIIGRNESCHKLNDTNSAIYLYSSGDQGRTWKRYAGPIARSAFPDGARCVPEPGVIRAVRFDGEKRQFTLHDSRDRGLSWSEPFVGRLEGDWERDVFREGCLNDMSGFCQLNDGSLFASIGHNYADIYDAIPNVGEGDPFPKN